MEPGHPESPARLAAIERRLGGDGLARVAIFDFDVHYGNGTSDIFRREPRVLVCQTYQHPLYPFWEGAPEAKHIVDAPLPPGAGGAEFRAAVQSHWLPAVERFRPE